MTRSRQKELRRQFILDAAEGLIRDTRSTDFSMLALAERAGLSPATPYNAFGTKSSILYALLTRSLDSIFSGFDRLTEKMGPYDVVLFAGRAAANFFIADPDYYRPLYHYLIGVSDQVYRPAYMDRALGYWRSALAPLCDKGDLANDVERDTLARHLIIQFVGALDLWTQSELSDGEFRAHIAYGVASALCGIADEEARAMLRDEIRNANRVMPRDYSFLRAVESTDRSLAS